MHFLLVCYLTIFHSVFASASSTFSDELDFRVAVYGPRSVLSKKDLPDDVVFALASYLDPLSIVKLSQTNERYRKLFCDDFWVQYNLSHDYQTFDEERSFLFFFSHKVKSPPVKVLISNHYYELGIKKNNKFLIKKASDLGLPKAKKYLEKDEHSYTSYTPGSYRGYDAYCYKCMSFGHHISDCYGP